MSELRILLRRARPSLRWALVPGGGLLSGVSLSTTVGSIGISSSVAGCDDIIMLCNAKQELIILAAFSGLLTRMNFKHWNLFLRIPKALSTIRRVLRSDLLKCLSGNVILSPGLRISHMSQSKSGYALSPNNTALGNGRHPFSKRLKQKIIEIKSL